MLQTASILSFRATMSPFLPTASLALESRTQWAPRAHETKLIPKLWVCLTCQRTLDKKDNVILTAHLGIIPRAAALLFDKLDGSNKSAGSGIRAPSRLSGIQNFTAKSSTSQANRNWQLRATYVEVMTPQPNKKGKKVKFKKARTDASRSTMSNFATCYYPKT